MKKSSLSLETLSKDFLVPIILEACSLTSESLALDSIGMLIYCRESWLARFCSMAGMAALLWTLDSPGFRLCSRLRFDKI
jgi:hypothetical protein